MAGSKRSTRDKFHIGQRVIWTGRCRPGSRRSDGQLVCTVRSQRQLIEYKQTGRRYLVYRLDVDGHGERGKQGNLFAAPQRELRPIYDGDRPVSWSECAWRPSAVRV